MAFSPTDRGSDHRSQHEIAKSTDLQRPASKVADGLWCASILIALWLPLLSGLGYELLDAEMLTLALISSLLAAVLVMTSAPAGICRFLFLSMAIFAMLDLYFVDTANWIKGGVILAIIATLIWIMRSHALRIVGVGSLAFSVAVLATASPLTPAPFTFNKQGGLTTQSPSIVHLILDEHSGAGGLPQEIFGGQRKDELIERYEKIGFKVYTNVRSSSNATKFSLSSFMNGQATPPKSLLEEWGRYRFRKKSERGFEYEMGLNKYLTEAVARGYQVHVLQSSYLDICTQDLIDKIDCRTYPHTSAAVLDDLELSPSDRALIFFGLVNWKFAGQHASFLYDEWSRTGPGERISGWLRANATGRLHPLVASQMLDYASREIMSAPRGQLFVFHLLLPHRPYVFDEECNVLSPVEWTDDEKISNLQVRQEIYLRYYDQMACTDTRIATFIETALRNPRLADATFIIHGDHGSRNGPTYASTLGPAYSKSDFENDWYTTLFAVRSPTTAPGTSSERMGLTDIFWASLESTFSANGETAQAQ